MEYVQGPDFPTAGIINGRAGIVQAYRTGRGRIYVRARAEVMARRETNKDTIIITEIPYQLNKARLIEKIAELVKDKRIEGITELRDESDKDGLRMVIELRRGESGRCGAQQPLRADPAAVGVRHQLRGAGERPAKGTSTSSRCSRRFFSIAARWLPAAPSTCCAARANGATFSKARRWRWRTSIRWWSSSKSHQTAAADARVALMSRGWAV